MARLLYLLAALARVGANAKEPLASVNLVHALWAGMGTDTQDTL